MKITIYNGSPKMKKSNTNQLLSLFIKGFCSIEGNTATVHYLANKKERDKQIEDFENEELIIIAMPLYCDAMPSIVKDFIEALPDKTQNGNRKLGFIIQAGFQESYQLSFLKAYLDTIPKYIPCQYLGTVAKGGVDALNSQPAFIANKVYKNIERLGKNLAINGVFDRKITNLFAKPYKYSTFELFLFKTIFSKVAENYWNKQLKANRCFEQRYDKPYM